MKNLLKSSLLFLYIQIMGNGDSSPNYFIPVKRIIGNVGCLGLYISIIFINKCTSQSLNPTFAMFRTVRNILHC